MHKRKSQLCFTINAWKPLSKKSFEGRRKKKNSPQAKKIRYFTTIDCCWKLNFEQEINHLCFRQEQSELGRVQFEIKRKLQSWPCCWG